MSLSSINIITKNIFLGNWSSSVNPILLKKYKIKYIIGLNTQSKTYDNLHLYKKLEITYLHINQRDIVYANISRVFPITNRFIHMALKKNKNILVHCTMGISRASTIVIAFLLWKYYINMHNKNIINRICHNHSMLLNIYNYVKTKREQICPNPGFIIQLQMYEVKLIRYRLGKILNKT